MKVLLDTHAWLWYYLGDGQHAIFDNGFTILPIEPRHTAQVAALAFPVDHKDPFDRLQIAQVLVETIPIVSGDAVFDSYGVSRIW